jgi:hypothetical protein
LPSGYEILQACTLPTKVFPKPFPVPEVFGKIGVRTISMNYVLVSEVRGKNFSQL